MVLTTTMVFAQTDGIELVLLNHTCTRGPSVTRMRDFYSNPSSCSLNYVFNDSALNKSVILLLHNAVQCAVFSVQCAHAVFIA